MNRVFVDTAYWIARTNPKDRRHYAARRASRGLGKVRLVTTEEVLSEWLNWRIVCTWPAFFAWQLWAPSRRRRGLPGRQASRPHVSTAAKVAMRGAPLMRLPANAAARANVRAGTPAHPGSPCLRRDGAQASCPRGAPVFRTYYSRIERSEFLTGFSERGAYLRDAAARIAGGIAGNPDIEVLPQSHESFTTALELFRQRSDKGYSMQDCASMHAMRTSGISEVLSSDLHFEQEGFTVLMK